MTGTTVDEAERPSRCSAGMGGELVDVDDRAPHGRLVLVVVAHADLTKVPRVVLVKVGAVVVLTTGETTPSRVLAVLADTSVTGGDVPPVLTRVREAGRHGDSLGSNEQVPPC